MQPKHLIEAAKENDLGEVFTRHAFAQVCNTFKVFPGWEPDNFIQVMDNQLKSFKKERSSQVADDIEVLDAFGEKNKVNLVYEVLKTKQLQNKLLGWMRIDERKISNQLFEFYATVETNLAFFVLQEVKKEYFLHIFATHERSKTVAEYLRPYLAEQGIALTRCLLEEDKIKELKTNLGLRTVEEVIENVWPGIKIRATGEGIDKEKNYLEVTKEGKRNSFVFRSPMLLDKKSANLFRISTKGLTHFMNKIKPRFHLDFITSHLIPIFSYETAIVAPEKEMEKAEKKPIHIAAIEKK